jgi:small-conductance mechanosensitive channel
VLVVILLVVLLLFKRKPETLYVALTILALAVAVLINNPALTVVVVVFKAVEDFPAVAVAAVTAQVAAV